MLINDNIFVEVDSSAGVRSGNIVSGDVFLHKRYEDSIVSVLCSGGSGDNIKRNIVSSLCSSVAISSLKLSRNIDTVARLLIEITQTDSDSDATPGFTIVKIDLDSRVEIVTYGTPKPVCYRQNMHCDFPVKKCSVEINPSLIAFYNKTTFTAQPHDRIVFFNNGILDDPFGGRMFDFSLRWEKILRTISDNTEQESEISAHDLCRKIIESSYEADQYSNLRDKSCTAIYFRRPRKVLVCTGPPYNEEKDKYLASRVRDYDGEIVICGGTTASILSRELNREVSVLLGRDPSGLPNASKMEGVSMVTEGVLTLGKVRLMLETLTDTSIKGRGIDVNVVKLLLTHDVIEFLVGTRINSMHQDPNVPVELELRRNVVKDIAKLLKERYMKEVSLIYI